MNSIMIIPPYINPMNSDAQEPRPFLESHASKRTRLVLCLHRDILGVPRIYGNKTCDMWTKRCFISSFMSSKIYIIRLLKAIKLGGLRLTYMAYHQSSLNATISMMPYRDPFEKTKHMLTSFVSSTIGPQNAWWSQHFILS